jgi:hypothetical protein
MSKSKNFNIGVSRDLPGEVYDEICEFALKEIREYVENFGIAAHVHYNHPGLIYVIFNDEVHDTLNFKISRSTGTLSFYDLYIVVRYREIEYKYDLRPQYVTNITGGPASMVDFIKTKINKELKTNVVINWDGPEGRYLKHDMDMCANTFTISSKAFKKEVTNMIFGVGEIIPFKIIFNDPATIVYWSDGTKTVVKKQKGDAFKKETGLAMCYVKKFCGNNTSRGLNDILSLAGTRKKPKKKKGAK